MRTRLTRIISLAVAICLFLAGQQAFAQSVTALPHLDVNNLSGAWYQIARYPNKREKLCTGDSLELVALDDKPNRLQLVDSCLTAKNYSVVHNYTAKIDKQTDGKLKIPTFFPLARPYWVLAIAPDNAWLVIGEANHKQLWIFSKTPTLNAATLAQIEALTSAAGFSTATLVFPPQKDAAKVQPAASSPQPQSAPGPAQ